jgi:ABC-2 type transport system ATP-binding protein
LEDIILIEHLAKSYGNLKAVDDISFSVKKGTVFGLLGANGAGKSTTIECILGTKKADSGVVSVLGMNPTTNRKELFEQVGVQFQEAHYQENIKVYELCEVTASLYKSAADYKQLLKDFGIADKGGTLVKELSGGQKQRLFIVLALIPKPKVVFLDELTTGLDARARRDVWQILKRLKADGLTILLTSHFMDEVEILCDIICILKMGKPVFYGTVTEAINQSPHDKFEDAYLWFTDERSEDNESL